MKVISASNPIWGNPEKTQIILQVVFSELLEDFPDGVGFRADPTDCEPHGVQIFNDAAAGKYGPIAPYAPPVFTKEQIVAILSSAIQSALDAGSQVWGYDSLASAISYLNSTIAQYTADAKALIAWRDTVWSWAIPQFANITAGELPTTFMAAMPVQPTKPVI